MNAVNTPVITVAYETAEAALGTAWALVERVDAYKHQAEALCDLLRDTEAARPDTLECARVMLAGCFAFLYGALAGMSPAEAVPSMPANSTC